MRVCVCGLRSFGLNFTIPPPLSLTTDRGSSLEKISVVCRRFLYFVSAFQGFTGYLCLWCSLTSKRHNQLVGHFAGRTTGANNTSAGGISICGGTATNKSMHGKSCLRSLVLV